MLYSFYPFLRTVCLLSTGYTALTMRLYWEKENRSGCH